MPKPTKLKILGVLLWHHFCYYKRHRFMLVVNIFVPAIICLCIWGFSKEFLAPEKMHADFWHSPGLNSLAEGWLLPYGSSEMRDNVRNSMFYELNGIRWKEKGNQRLHNGTRQFQKCWGTGRDPDDRWFTPLTKAEEQQLICMDTISTIQRRVEILPDFKIDSTLSLLLLGDIIYFPNDTLQIDRIVRNMKESLKDFFELPIFVATKIGDENLTSTAHSCFSDLEKRVKGLSTKSDSIRYVKTALVTSEKLEGYCDYHMPNLWGIVDFGDLGPENNQYSILQDLNTAGYSDQRGLQLQSVVEHAILKAEGQQPRVNLRRQPQMPTKCWKISNTNASPYIDILLSFLVVMGFIAFALNCTYLMVSEKTLRLREYMAIMGVTTTFLKFSWFVFYSVYLVFACATATVILKFGLKDLFPADMSYFLVFVLFFIFNITRLAYTYVLAAIMQKADNINTLVTTLDIVVWVIAAFSFRNLSSLTGGKLIFARIASFHFIVPCVIGCSYFAHWGQIWMGLDINMLWLSPIDTDYYGGLGACFLHFVLDIVFYFFLSWYIENVFPGEFGQKQPFYFCFNPTFWLDTRDLSPQNTHREMQEVLNASEGICIQDLTKIYPNGFKALTNFTETFCSNQITAFLGKNGAGKSTTMNMMVGLFNSTSGAIHYNDLDVSRDLKAIRERIGFVPQYDILYPDLTLLEHAKFYGWLRGLSSKEIDLILGEELKKLDLDSSGKNTATKLSGGQKRKLSLLTAYLGNPEFVILDEPTSGVDSFSARNIWDTILRHRSNTTTILSTHQMDEADLLADWITIIESGELKCSGTPLQLKEQYGQGFRVIISPGDASPQDVKTIRDLMMHNMQLGASEVLMEGSDIICKIPKNIASTQTMVHALESLERTIDQLDVGASYGVTEPSLEDVFFKATSLNDEGLPKIEESAADVFYEPASGLASYIQQAEGQIVKRFWGTVTSWPMCAYQLLLPLMFIGLMLLITTSMSGYHGDRESYHTIQVHAPYRKNVWFVQGKGSEVIEDIIKSMITNGIGRSSTSKASENEIDAAVTVLFHPVNPAVARVGKSLTHENCSCETHCPESMQESARKAPKAFLPGGDMIFGVNGVPNLFDWLVIANSTPDMIMGGLLYENSDLGIYAKAGHMPAVLNGINNVFLRINHTKDSGKHKQIKYSLELIRLDESVKQGGQSEGMTMLIVTFQLVFIMFAFMSATKGIAVFIMNEKEFGVKRLQFLANTNRVVYWLCNFVWDFSCFMVTLTVICIIIKTVSNPLSDYVSYLLPVLIPYGMLMITHIYFLTMFFRKTSYLTTTIEVLAVVFLACSITLTVFDDYENFFCVPKCIINEHEDHPFKTEATENEENRQRRLSACFSYCAMRVQSFFWAKCVALILRFHPLHLLIEGLTCFSFMMLSLGYVDHRIMKLIGNTAVSEKIKFMYGGRILQYGYFGRSITYGIVGSFTYISITLLLEFLLPNGYSCLTRFGKKPAPAEPPTDLDVQKEQSNTMTLPSGASIPLVVKELTKTFKSMTRPAVHNVTFSIKSAETFGLLGVNGAGKTTTFRMLAGFETPDHGSCEIDGYDVRKAPIKAGKNIMYCPQENILFKGLSVRQHLDIFGRFMRIPKHARNDIVNNMIKELGLEQYEAKMVGTLSGGNQRKVQLALALMDYPKMIFLDEPTTGMDPMARRLAWDAINRAVSKGSAVVLTSHSMEECEVLCNRLVIMVAGRLQCIGSAQYLKNKLGNRYTFKIRLKNRSTEDSEALKSEISAVFGSDARLLEHHSTVLQYEIDSKDLGYPSKLFEVLIHCQDNLHVQSFTVSQVTLEHVFVNMAKRAVEEEEAAKIAGKL